MPVIQVTAGNVKQRKTEGQLGLGKKENPISKITSVKKTEA
jgi:hypothetical protein